MQRNKKYILTLVVLLLILIAGLSIFIFILNYRSSHPTKGLLPEKYLQKSSDSQSAEFTGYIKNLELQNDKVIAEIYFNNSNYRTQKIIFFDPVGSTWLDKANSQDINNIEYKYKNPMKYTNAKSLIKELKKFQNKNVLFTLLIDGNYENNILQNYISCNKKFLDNLTNKKYETLTCIPYIKQLLVYEGK